MTENKNFLDKGIWYDILPPKAGDTINGRKSEDCYQGRQATLQEAQEKIDRLKRKHKPLKKIITTLPLLCIYTKKEKGWTNTKT